MKISFLSYMIHSIMENVNRRHLTVFICCWVPPGIVKQTLCPKKRTDHRGDCTGGVFYELEE